MTEQRMKKKAFHVLVAHRLLAVVTLGIVFKLAAQNYFINWHKTAGGGGTSTNGQYAVSGTIGQSDAGRAMTNGQFSVTGGFWTVSVVQTDGAPWLSIVPSAPGFALISWVPDTAGFVLQEIGSVAATNWINSPSGASNRVVVPVSMTLKFYRLRQQ